MTTAEHIALLEEELKVAKIRQELFTKLSITNEFINGLEHLVDECKHEAHREEDKWRTKQPRNSFEALGGYHVED